MPETVVTVEHTPGVTTTTTTSGGLSWMKFNLEYFKSIPGILKLVQLVFGIICMALASPVYLSATHFFLFVAVTAFICTLLWSFAYLLGIREALNFAINWILTILGILCFSTATGTISASQFFLFVAVTSWICCLIWIIFYMFSIREAISSSYNWIFIEFCVTALWTIFFFIAFIVQFAVWSYVDKTDPNNKVKGRNMAAGVFGLFNFCTYCVGLVFLVLEWKRGTTM